MSEQHGTGVRELHEFVLRPGVDLAGARAAMDQVSDQIMDSLVDQESDGLTADAAVAVDFGARTIEIEMLVRTADANAAVSTAAARIARAIEAAGLEAMPASAVSAERVALVPA